MRAVRTTVVLSLALLTFSLAASRASAQVRLFTPFNRGIFGPAFSFPFSSGYYPGFYGPGYGYGFPYGGYSGNYGGFDPYGYGATFAPYSIYPIPVAYASSRGTYTPRATYAARTNYVSPTPYTEPSFVRPAGYVNTYYSSEEDATSIRTAAYSSESVAFRPHYFPTTYMFFYGPICP